MNFQFGITSFPFSILYLKLKLMHIKKKFTIRNFYRKEKDSKI